MTRYYVFFYYAPTMLIFFLDWLFNISMRTHSEVILVVEFFDIKFVLLIWWILILVVEFLDIKPVLLRRDRC